MATQNFINECKNRANANRLAKFNIDNLALNQTNYISKIELKDSCYVNKEILGAIFVKSADVSVLNLPLNTELVGKTIAPQIGVRYSDDTTEYVEFDNYTIESLKDEQTGSSTDFTAMGGGSKLDEQYNCTLTFENGDTHTIYEFYQDVCNQLGLTPTDLTFDNDDLVMTGNPFQNKESCRVVLGEVEKVSCTIADINWKNATISLTWLSSQIDYEFNTSDYSSLEGSLEQYGPLNTIILGNSQLDGENVVMVDQESVEEYGEHSIMIDAKYFLYTEELRTQAIQAIYDKLDGLTYYDLKLTTPYGKPFLKIGDKIRINTNENQVYDTYVLTHTFTFNGTFGSVIESPALTSQEQKVRNEMSGNSIKERLVRTEVIVNKAEGDINLINEKVDEVQDEFGNYYTIDQTNVAIANAKTGITNTFSEAGGNNIFRNLSSEVAKKIQEEPYIESAKMNRKIPDTIEITVKEREVSYQVNVIDSFVYLDYQGYILEKSKEQAKVPFIEGLKTSQDELLNGKRLINDDLAHLNTILRIVDNSKNIDIYDKITKITIQDHEYAIYFKDEKKIAYLGNGTNITNKMLYLKAILQAESGKSGKIFVNGNFSEGFKSYFREEKID